MPEEPTLLTPEEERERQQAFIDSEGEIPPYEKGDFEPQVGAAFSAVGMNGPVEVELTLDDIESLPESVHKRRKDIRRFPFILEFVTPDAVRLPDGMYRLTSKSDSEVSYFLFIKAIDQIASEKIMVYESVVN